MVSSTVELTIDDIKVATPVLALALEHQTARVASNATLVANFYNRVTLKRGYRDYNQLYTQERL